MRSRHWTLSVFYGMQEVGRVRDSTLHLLRTPPPTKIVVANAKFISFCQNKKEVNNIAVSNRLPQQNEPYISHRSCHPLLSPHIAAGCRSPQTHSANHTLFSLISTDVAVNIARRCADTSYLFYFIYKHCFQLPFCWFRRSADVQRRMQPSRRARLGPSCRESDNESTDGKGCF